MNIAIVDDDKEVHTTLKQVLKEYETQYGVAFKVFSYWDGESFIRALENHQTFTIVFMDIFMEKVDGMEAAMNLRQSQNLNSLLVFLTSTSDFMAQAFSYHAFDYVLKPIDHQRIFHLLQEAQQFIPNESPYMEISSGRSTYRLLFSQIVSAVSDAHYLEITSSEGRVYRCRMTLHEFYKKTHEDKRFLSLNKGIYVNIDYINSLQQGSCHLKNGSVFPIRVRDMAKIESIIHDYNFLRIRNEQHRNHKGER
ncbi:MAG: LytTR family DNA-binding domain-containing protein [Allobaculum sp.]|nr:LytTR family DNA-binding domain-containing protein [Allobaculum sp.]